MSNTNKKTSTAPVRRRAGLHRQWSVAEGELGLLDYLVQVALADRSRTTVKQLLKDRFISVNGMPTTQFDHTLHVGDIVALHPMPLPTGLRHEQVEILWQDEDLVMIYKDAGIPTVASGEERDMTALRLVSDHLKKFSPRAKVYLLNRVDKDSAGFVLFAKSKILQEEMTEHWSRYVCRQQFAVAVEGILEASEGLLLPPAPKEGDKKPKRLARPAKSTGIGSEQAGTARYRCLKATEVGSLLSIELQEGRNNRLRKQLAALKCPIIGDWRAGSTIKDLGRVALEGTAFSFIHPTTAERHDFERPISPRLRKCLNAEALKTMNKSKR